MRETVAVSDGLTLCHKNASGLVQATVPDVCKTPVGSSTPPLPYPNIAFARDLAKGTKTVKSHGGAMCGIKGSEFSRSTGDEAGTAKGVKSGTITDRASFILWSPNVFAEGKNVTRLTDHMLMNEGNTVSMGGYYTGDVTGAGADDLEILCQYACECLEVGRLDRQNCVAERIREDYYDGAYPQYYDNGMCPEVSMTHLHPGVWGVIMNRAGTGPTSNPITPQGGIRPDVLCRAGGRNARLVEMKFPGDELSRRQRELYPVAAEQIEAENITLDVENECDCSGGGGNAPEPVTAPSAAPRVSPNPDFPIPSEQVPMPPWPWGAPLPAGDWCRPLPWPAVGFECVRGG